MTGGLGLHMQVAVRLVGFPPADEEDVVAVDAGAEKGHGAAGVGGAGGDVCRGETKVRTGDGCGTQHVMCDVQRKEVAPRALDDNGV